MKKAAFALVLLMFTVSSCSRGIETSYNTEVKLSGAITDAHLHIQSILQAPALLEAMEANGILRTTLVGSPDSTIYRRGNGYKGYKRNNEQVIEIAKKYPGRFIPLVALDPAENDKPRLLKKYLGKGARGIKLYSGHSMFYNHKLNSRDMYEVYAFASQRGLPVIFHVNAGKPVYLYEFERVLKDFPDLRVICPHFCLSSIELTRLERLLETYPNLYTDVSFGAFIAPGLRRISKNPDKYREFAIRFQDRILFGTDIVATRNPIKDAQYLTATQRAYLHMLAKDEYYYPYFPGLKLRGLALEERVLRKIYVENAVKIFRPPADAHFRRD